MKWLHWKIFLFVLFVVMTFSVSAQNISITDSLEKVLARTSDPEKRVDLTMDLAMETRLSDPQRALQYADKAIELASKSDNPKKYSAALLLKSLVCYFLSDLQNALSAAMKAKEFAESKDLQKELALSMDALGMVYYEIGDENKSSDYFFSSLKIYEKLNDKKGIGQTYCRIGTLYHNQKEEEKAIDYYQKSIEIARKLKNEEGIASNLHNLAAVYTSEGKINQAMPLYFEALAINRASGNLQLEGSNYLNIGNLYLKLGKYDSAMLNVQLASDIFSKIGNQVRLAKSGITEGEILLAMIQYDKALVPAKEALDISLKNGYKDNISESASLLHRLYLSKKDTINAYRYSVLENSWNDSLSLGENKKTLAKLEMQYQFEKREQQIRIEKQRKNFFLVFLGIIAFFSMVVIILLRSRYRLKEKKAILEKQNLEKDLDYKKKELTANVMSLMKKNEMLSEITQKIIKIKKESEQDETKSALKKIITELQKSTDQEILKEFSMRFREVHSDFYDNLLKKHPGLSPSELKLCAFLRLNMTTKEIAELTGQQISSLENARYRLRQKLGIKSSEINLVTFLAQV